MNITTGRGILRYRQFVFSMLVVFFVAGCAHVSIDSNRDSAYTEKLNRLYVVVNHGHIAGQYSETLANGLMEAFSQEDIECEILIVNPLELDEKTYLDKIASYQPQAVLVIKTTGGTVTPDGYHPTIVYDASLYEQTTDKRIWRARIVASGHAKKRLTMMVGSIVSQLKEDGLI